MAIMRKSQVLTVGAASGEVTVPLDRGQSYMIISTTNCWFRMAETATAAVAAAANNIYLPADTPMTLHCDTGDAGYISVIQASAGGTVCLVTLE